MIVRRIAGTLSELFCLVSSTAVVSNRHHNNVGIGLGYGLWFCGF